MTTRIFTIERVFNTTSEILWQALTQKELMKQWYFDLQEFKAEVGFVFEFMGGENGKTQYLHRCEITEVIPEQKLVHTWCYVGYKGISYLTFELFAEGENTRLVLTHSGLETFPDDIPDLAFHNFEAGWTHIIGTSLKNFLEKK